MVNPVNIYIFLETAQAQDPQQSAAAFFLSLVLRQLNPDHPYPEGASALVAPATHPFSASSSGRNQRHL